MQTSFCPPRTPNRAPAHPPMCLWRWITLARDVDEEVLQWIAENFSTLSPAFLVGNQYVTGTGASWRSKMSHKYATVALGLLLDDMETQTVSATRFVTE